MRLRRGRQHAPQDARSTAGHGSRTSPVTPSPTAVISEQAPRFTAGYNRSIVTCSSVPVKTNGAM